MTKMCECGCGGQAPIATQTKARHGHVAGQPMRFIRGHAMRGRSVSPETRAAIGAAHRGKPKSSEQRAKMRAAQLGPKASRWTGGVITREGRELRYVGREHPMADSYGYAYTHRLVASEALGRPLARREHVHHLDLDPTNNAPGNLAVLTRSQHTRIHNLIRDGVEPHLAAARVLG